MKSLLLVLPLFYLNIGFAKPIQLAQVVMNEASLSEMNQDDCINSQYSYCNTNSCALPSDISSSPNCQQICQKRAKEKCRNGVTHTVSAQKIRQNECRNTMFNNCNLNSCALQSDISNEPNCQEICKKRAREACR